MLEKSVEKNFTENKSYDDENIFEIIEIFWRETPLFLTSVAFAMLVGFSFSLFVDSKNITRFEYVLGFPALDHMNGTEVKPMRRNHIIEGILKNNLKGDWKLSNRKYSSNSSPAESVEQFKAELKRAVAKVNQFVLGEARANIAVIENTVPRHLQSSPSIATKYLQSVSLINDIENRGKDAILIEKTVFRKFFLPVYGTFLISLSGGLCLGIMLILLKHNYRLYNLRKTAPDNAPEIA